MHVSESDVWRMQKVSGLPPAAGGPLLRCFVRREMGGERAVAKFQLFLGSEHNEPDSSKFLMAALLTSRCWQHLISSPAHILGDHVYHVWHSGCSFKLYCGRQKLPNGMWKLLS